MISCLSQLRQTVDHVSFIGEIKFGGAVICLQRESQEQRQC